MRRRVGFPTPDPYYAQRLANARYVASRARRAAFRRGLPWVLAGLAATAETACPLARGQARRALAVAAVMLFFLAVVTHAWTRRGPAWACGLTILAGGTGFTAEAIGVRTGLPFGAYSYTDMLGPRLLGVPVVIPLAWVALAYPALLMGRRLSRRLAPLTAGWALAGWGVLLGPLLTTSGAWSWARPEPTLPGVPGLPLAGLAGRLAVCILLMTLAHQVLPHHRRVGDAQPVILCTWTYALLVLVHLTFLGQPSVALVGGIALGLVLVPFLAQAWRETA